VNTHLSATQISECLIGGAALAVDQHARECVHCQAEVALLSDSLSRFRGAMGRWSSHVDGAEYQVVFRGTPARPAYGSWRLAGVSSLAAHAMLLAAVFVLGAFHPVQKLVKQQFTELELDLRPYLAENKRLAGGGGGGGARQLVEASKGKLPKPEPRQFTPPRVDPVEAKLQMPPSIIAPPDVPNLQANNFGDPLSKLGIPSNGTGFGGGIGSGAEGGVGPGHGAGAGTGSDAGFGGGVYKIGGRVSAPSVLFKVEPEYSEEARKAKWQGTVVLSVIVDEMGRPSHVSVQRSLGLGLDQKAMDAVSQWRFKPGLKDGKAVPVIATIEVNFRLL
jgi:periplasmic protein TonB